MTGRLLILRIGKAHHALFVQVAFRIDVSTRKYKLVLGLQFHQALSTFSIANSIFSMAMELLSESISGAFHLQGHPS